MPVTKIFIGSSPRARGTHAATARSSGAGRFIPASAGNTSANADIWDSPAVHPRERGEHSATINLSSATSGSSPRARGTRSDPAVKNEVKRFIPASAGNTQSGTIQLLLTPVHPRERGEHAIWAFRSALAAGSSPRARGTPPTATAENEALRFIPASAGNTLAANCWSAGKAVHPRERGEHRSRRRMVRQPFGSSPRARGTHGEVVPSAYFQRFIPASAGNTRSGRRWAIRPAVHPRERGEHTPVGMPFSSHTGSSPRARGTHRIRLCLEPHSRFIPASAGNTRFRARCRD